MGYQENSDSDHEKVPIHTFHVRITTGKTDNKILTSMFRSSHSHILLVGLLSMHYLLNLT